jgi:hypothetical protein
MVMMFFLPGWWRLAGFVLWLALDVRGLLLARKQGSRRDWTRAIVLTIATVGLGLLLFWNNHPHSATAVLSGVVLGCLAAWYLAGRRS